MSDEGVCGTCPFWAAYRAVNAVGHDIGPSDRGACHHVALAQSEELTRDATWWCSEHPLRQRDHLAAMAMVGMLGSPDVVDGAASLVADFAYRFADAMLAERRKGRP